MKTFDQFLETRDPELRNQILKENLAVDAANWVGSKFKSAYDWHKSILNTVIDGLKSQFGEMRKDAKNILASGWENLKPPQIRQIQDAVANKDWRTVGKVLLTVGVVFATLFHVGAGASHGAENKISMVDKEGKNTDGLSQKELLQLWYLKKFKNDSNDETKDSLLNKGYKDVTNMKDWTMPSPSNNYKITHDDLLNNVHDKIKDMADDGDLKNSIVNKERDELIAGVDYKIFQIIPSKFIPAMSKDPSQFNKSYEKLKTLKPPKEDYFRHDRKITSTNSAQRIEHLDDSKIVVFINSGGASKNMSGFEPGQKVKFAGVSTKFKALVYDKDKKKYDGKKRNELITDKLKGGPMFKSNQVVIPYPGDLSTLDIEKLPPEMMRIIFHELRHTTQSGLKLGSGEHVLGMHSDLAKDQKGEPSTTYLENAHEFGVRVAAFKDASGPDHIKDIFNSSINQALDSSKANKQEKEGWKKDIKSKFERWISSEDVDRAIDLIHMKKFGEKMGFVALPELEEDEIQTNFKKGINGPTLTPKQEFYNKTIEDFLYNFYDQDSQIGEMWNAMNNPYANPDTGLEGFPGKEQIFGELRGSEMEDKILEKKLEDYKEKFKIYLKSNWNYIVKKGSQITQNA